MEIASVDVEAKQTLEKGLPYYPVSPLKITLLSLATFGFYNIWWFYRQWRHVRDYTGENIRPVWRAIFSPLFCFPLFGEVSEDLKEHSLRLWIPSVVLGLIFLASIATRKLPDPYSFLYFLHIVPLLVVQVAINQLVALHQPNAVLTTKFGFGNGIVISLGGVLWLLVIIGSFTPETRMLHGSELQAPEIDYLQSKGYLLPDEEIIYFYSAGMWSIHEDGNIITDQRIISYENDGGVEYHTSAYYHEIYSVDVIYSDSWLDDTQITVTTTAGDEIYLVVSAEENRDEVFVRRLHSEWRKRVPEGEEQLTVPPTDPASEMNDMEVLL